MDKKVKKQKPTARVDATRHAAVRALLKQEQGGYANLVLTHILEALPPQCSARDRAFLSAVFYGTVERQVTLDYILQHFLAKPLCKLDAEVRAILRSGLYQARYLDSVPTSAAVNEAVALTRAFGKSSAAGMVNAVLRKAAAFPLPQTYGDTQERICVQYSVTRPVAALLQKALPQHFEAFLEASLQQPMLCLRVNTLRISAQALAQQLEAIGAVVQAGDVPGSLYVTFSGDITATELFRAGLFHVQGEGSQLACAALAPQPGQTVLDLCAAPGGKTLTLAQYMEDSGTLYSCDVAQSRLPLIEAACKRAKLSCVQVLHNDASVYQPRFAQADAVLCDVPCSGLGILAKKPDLRLKELSGLPQLIALQHEILHTAARYVAPGGRLVYSTCTVNPEENEAVVQEFLAQSRAFETVLPTCLPKGTLVQNNMVTLLPPLSRTDGFFVALLQKQQK